MFINHAFSKNKINMIDKQNLGQAYIYFFIFILLSLCFFFINYGNLVFDYSYRNNTIYFPIDYDFANLKENPFSQAEYDWGWSNARWLGAIIESKIIYPNINSIYQLKIAKIIGIVINIVSSFIFFIFLKKINVSAYKSFVISVGIFTLPGFLYFNHIGTLTSHITYLFVIITGYFLYFCQSFKIYFILLILFLLCISIYSPAIFIILIFPASAILISEKNEKIINDTIIFKKFFYFIVAGLLIFYVFKTFFIKSFYEMYHGKEIVEFYNFFTNEHINYNTNTKFTGQFIILVLFKIFLFFTDWLKSDFNFWNIYASWLPVLLVAILYIYLLKKNNIKFFFFNNNENLLSININKNSFKRLFVRKVFLGFGIYLIPVVFWLPFQTTLTVFRNTFSTSAVVLLLLIFIINNLFKDKINIFIFTSIFLISTVFSFINVYNNARSSFLEFDFAKNELNKINKNTKHIHVIHPKVGFSYLGFKSFNEEFNRPSILTWQENSRYINSALIESSISKVRKVNLHDCETKAYNNNKLSFPYYKIAFPTQWDLGKCLRDLKKNWILITFSHPHTYVDNKINNQSHLDRRSRYSDLTKGLNLETLTKEVKDITLFIDFNKIYVKENNKDIEKKKGLIEYLRSFAEN
jgi:hypothetical protein